VPGDPIETIDLLTQSVYPFASFGLQSMRIWIIQVPSGGTRFEPPESVQAEIGIT
jgi:hypothetical protein